MGYIEQMCIEKAAAVCQAFNELGEWIAENPKLIPYGKALEKKIEIECLTSLNAKDPITFKDGKTSKMSARDWFNKNLPPGIKFPKKGQALIWLPGILDKDMPPEVMAKARELLEKHGVEDLLWDILRVYFDKKEEEK